LHTKWTTVKLALIFADIDSNERKCKQNKVNEREGRNW
jgi:hypothetical protein